MFSLKSEKGRCKVEIYKILDQKFFKGKTYRQTQSHRIKMSSKKSAKLPILIIFCQSHATIYRVARWQILKKIIFKNPSYKVVRLFVIV